MRWKRCEGQNGRLVASVGLGLTAVLAVALAACSGNTRPSENTQGPTAGSGPASSSAPSGSQGTQAPDAPSGSAPSDTASPESPEQDAADQRVQTMTTRQKAGQVIMAGVPVDKGRAAAQGWAEQLGALEIGNVFLTGRSSAGAQEVRQLSDTLRGSVTAEDLAPWIAVDQEGGSVQTLKGNGFSVMPNALTQGGWSAKQLEEQAETWGEQLVRAGVNMNLGPVADTVPQGTAGNNPPIGYYSRQYGSTAEAVTESSSAFASGMQKAGVAPVLKHFPGLGLVHGNTDTTADVRDEETGEGSEQVEPFKAQIEDGAPWIMVSSAIYPKLDPDAPATFSKPVLTDFLRDELGFDGAVISDDLCSAQAVRAIPLQQRAERFLKAGGDLFLCAGGASQSQVKELSGVIVKAAESDPEMKKALDRAATVVVASKLRD